MPKAFLNGFELYYEAEGDGEPLVLIPGFASGLALWSGQAGPLSRDFRVVTFDPRGVARSGIPDGPLTIDLLADDVAALLNSLGIESAYILGVSFGGFVAQEFALRYPRMTRKLVLCCTSFGGPNHVQPSPEIMDQILRVRATEDAPEHVALLQLQAAMAFNVEDRLAEIECPTLIVTGDADVIVPVQNSYNLARRVPNAELQLVGGGSHTFFMEQPEQFNQVLTQWLLQK